MVDVVPLRVADGLSAGAVSPLAVDDVLDVSDGLTLGDGDWLGEVIWGFFVPVAEETGVPLGDVAGGEL